MFQPIFFFFFFFFLFNCTFAITDALKYSILIFYWFLALYLVSSSRGRLIFWIFEWSKSLFTFNFWTIYRHFEYFVDRLRELVLLEQLYFSKDSRFQISCGTSSSLRIINLNLISQTEHPRSILDHNPFVHVAHDLFIHFDWNRNWKKAPEFSTKNVGETWRNDSLTIEFGAKSCNNSIHLDPNIEGDFVRFSIPISDNQLPDYKAIGKERKQGENTAMYFLARERITISWLIIVPLSAVNENHASECASKCGKSSQKVKSLDICI